MKARRAAAASRSARTARRRPAAGSPERRRPPGDRKTHRRPDPFVFLEGGPGEAATEDAAGLAHELAAHPRAPRHPARGPARDRGLESLELRALRADERPRELPRRVLPARGGAPLPGRARAGRRSRPSTRPSIAADDLDDVRGRSGTSSSISSASRTARARRSCTCAGTRTTSARSCCTASRRPTRPMPLHFRATRERALDGVLARMRGRARPAARPSPTRRRELRASARAARTAPAPVEILHPGDGRAGDGAPLARRRRGDAPVHALLDRRRRDDPRLRARRRPRGDLPAARGDGALLPPRHRRTAARSASTSRSRAPRTCPGRSRPARRSAKPQEPSLGDYRCVASRTRPAASGRAAKLPSDYRTSGARPTVPGPDPLGRLGSRDAARQRRSGWRADCPHSLHVVVPHGGHALRRASKGRDCVTRLRDGVRRARIDGGPRHALRRARFARQAVSDRSPRRESPSPERRGLLAGSPGLRPAEAGAGARSRSRRTARVLAGRGEPKLLLVPVLADAIPGRREPARRPFDSSSRRQRSCEAVVEEGGARGHARPGTPGSRARKP